MRAYSIALFFLMIQLASALLNYSNVFDVSEPVDTQLLTHLNNTMDNRVYGNQTNIEYGADFERSGITDTLETFGKAISVKHTLEQLGLDSTIATIVSYAVYFVYILGLVQLLLIRKGVGDVS